MQRSLPQAAPAVGSILRASKLARFDPRLPQVYTHVNGNWGAIKAPLPGTLPAQHLTFKALDSKYAVPDFRIADARVAAVRRMTEMFPYSGVPVAAGSSINSTRPKRNLADMPTREFARWVQANVPKFDTTKRLEGWDAQLGVEIAPQRNHRDTGVQGPCYTLLPEGEVLDRKAKKVHGRLIGKADAHHALVAVGGYMAEAEVGTHDLARNRTNHRAVAEYQIDSLTWDRRGRPHMHVSPANPLGSTRARTVRGYNARPTSSTISTGAVSQIGSLLKAVKKAGAAPLRSATGSAPAASSSTTTASKQS